MTILILLTLILVSFAGIIPNQLAPVWYPQLIVLSACLFLYINTTLWKFNKWLSLFLGYCLFSVMFSDLFYALYNLGLPTLRSRIAYGLFSFGKMSPRALIMLFHVYLCSYASYKISFLNAKQRKYILWTIASLIGINVLWSFLQYFNLDPIFHCIDNVKKDNIVGFMGSWNCFGSYVAIGTPVILAISPFLVIPLLLSVILAKVWYGVITLSVISFVCIFSFNKKLLRYFIPLLIFASLFMVLKYDRVGPDTFKGNRVAVWKTSVKSVLKGSIKIGEREIKCSPLFGYGFGNFPAIMPGYISQKFNTPAAKYNHAHNDTIEVLFDLGIVGFLLLLALLVSVLKRFIRTIKSKEFMIVSLCLLSYFLCSNAYFVSHMPATGMLLVIFYGLFESIGRENGTSTSLGKG